MSKFSKSISMKLVSVLLAVMIVFSAVSGSVLSVFAEGSLNKNNEQNNTKTVYLLTTYDTNPVFMYWWYGNDNGFVVSSEHKSANINNTTYNLWKFDTQQSNIDGAIFTKTNYFDENSSNDNYDKKITGNVMVGNVKSNNLFCELKENQVPTEFSEYKPITLNNSPTKTEFVTEKDKSVDIVNVLNLSVSGAFTQYCVTYELYEGSSQIVTSTVFSYTPNTTGKHTLNLFAKDMFGNSNNICTFTVTAKENRTNFAFDQSEVNVAYGKESIDIQPLTTDFEGVEYSSSDSSVAKITEDNKIELLKAGQVTITAKLAEDDTHFAAEASYTLNITKADREVTLEFENPNPVDLTFGKDSSFINKATFTDTDKNDAQVKYRIKEQSNGDTAEINVDSGELTIINAGSVTVEAYVDADDRYNAVEPVSYTVNISRSDDVKFENTTDNIEVKFDDTTFKNAIINADDAEVTYQSSDESIATVDENGVVTPVSVSSDTVTITATVGETRNYNKKEITYNLKIVNADIDAKFKISNPTGTYKDGLEIDSNLIATVKEGTVCSVEYTSSDTNVATVDANGMVYFNKAGKVSITANITAANYNAKKITNTITIEKASDSGFDFKCVTDNTQPREKTVTYGENGNTYDMSAFGGKSSGAVTYTSSAPESASIDENGVLTVIKACDNVTITATKAADDKYLKSVATYTFKINKSDRVWAYANTEKDVYYGQSYTALEPENSYTSKKVTYSITDANGNATEIATVDSTSGVVTINSKGITGTVKISASIAEDECYNVAEASYLLNVKYLDVQNIYTCTSDNLVTGEDFNGNVTVSPAANYKISYASDNGEYSWADSILIENNVKYPQFAFMYVGDGENKNAISDTVTSKIRVDKTAPAGTITVDNYSSWDVLLTTISFGLLGNEVPKFSIEYSDNTSNNFESDNVSAYYYIKEGQEEIALTKEALQERDASKWTKYKNKGTEGSINQYSVIYVKLVDAFGNVSYISTNGMMAESQAPTFNLKRDDIDYPFYGYFHNDFKVYITDVTDDADNTGVFSGVKSVIAKLYYKDVNNNKIEIKSYSLYDSETTEEGCESSYDFTIEASKLDYTNVFYEILVTDKFGNCASRRSTPFAVSSAPAVSMSIDYGDGTVSTVGENTSISNKEAKLTVSITQSTNGFKETDANNSLNIYFSDFKDSIVGLDDNWKSENGVYSKTLTLKDNKYKFSDKFVYQGVASSIEGIPLDLIVDTVSPKVVVSYDNNSPVYGPVYANIRTATFTVVDENFVGSDNMVEVTATNSKNEELDAPDISWNGMIGTIEFNNDANYSMKITDNFKDLAGNLADVTYADYTHDANSFSVDRANPTNLQIKYSSTNDNKTIVGTLMDLVENLTGGLIYFGNTVTVTVSAEDATTKIKEFEYSAELAADAGVGAKGIEKTKISDVKDNTATFTISPEYKGVVSVTSYDMANHSITSNEANGIVVSSKKPEISLNVSKGITHNNVTYYNDDITAEVVVEDVNFDKSLVVFNESTTYNYSTKVLKTYGNNEAYEWVREDGANKYKTTVTLKGGELNKGSEVFTVDYKNHSGHVATQAKAENMIIDRTNPQVLVQYDNNTSPAANGYYYNNKRIATITVTDDNFDGLQEMLGITAKDKSKKALTAPVLTWNGKVGTVVFDADAYYTLNINNEQFVDLAGNPAEVTTDSKDTNEFVVDKTIPTGLITVKDTIGNQIGGSNNTTVTNAKFEAFCNKSVNVNIAADDVMTATKTQYYISDKYLSANELNSLTQWQDYTSAVSLNPDKKFVAYAKIIDEAMNTIYISSDGIILDKTAPDIDGIKPQIKLNTNSNKGHTDKNGNVIYNGDVIVDYKITDPVVGSTCSGLKASELKYEVVCDGQVTQSGLLNGAKTDYENHLYTMSGSITVSSQINNSNNVKLVVYAADNANNTADSSTALMIDITTPIISVSYSNNTPDRDNTKLFKENRVATITINERNFDSNDVNITITKNGSKENVSTTWSDTGAADKDSYTHTSQITYAEDGDYTFAIEYTDEAANKAKSVDYGNSVAPAEFTIDKTKPQIFVNYDNNSAKNTNYYNKERTATITIEEHNFDASRVECSVTATDDGKSITAPSISSWTNNGDTHTATIAYSNDAKYNFAFSYVDMAGNEANKIENEEFYVDKIAPAVEVSGINYMSANNGKIGNIGYVLTTTDTNFDADSVDISFTKSELSGKDTNMFGNGTKTAITNGLKYTVNNILDDGIYNVVCTVTDMAGNTTEKINVTNEKGKAVNEGKLLFSVNREGSTFMIDNTTKTLVDTKYVQNVDNNITITEVNPDSVSDYVVTLGKGTSKTKVLTSGEDYTRTDNNAEGTWKTYTYNVKAGNFSEEAAYALAITSTDKAENTSYSETKNPEYSNTELAKVNFIVDRTIPQVVVTNIDNNGRYNVETQTVKVIAKDDNALSSVKVLLNDNLYHEYNIDELVNDNGEISIDIPSSQSLQNLNVVAVDAANNSTDDSDDTKIVYSNFLVTTNFFIQFINNTLALVITIISILLVIALVVFIVMRKRSKKKN